MKQILQDLRSGKIELAEIPRPLARPGCLLIATSRSLISTGTEKMLVEFGRAGWLEKARQQPEKVRQVLEKVKTDGFLPTIDAVFAKLDQPIPLGYCNCGTVLEVGEGVEGFSPGDRVISNGPHAEVVSVPRNLCARVPEGVTDDEAAFTVLASIALQGVRLAAPSLGETFVVVGLGLVGLLTAQILRASGCSVIGTDIAPGRAELARRCGVDVFVDAATGDPVAAALGATGGHGVDGVVIAAATKSNEPVAQAARMCRKRGRIILVGTAGLEISRSDFYEKEISFQVSCSYGPGRYDPAYEREGRDYPFGFVRWTEGRNFEAVLGMMATGKMDVRPLIGKVVPFDQAPSVYEGLSDDASGLGILLQYAESAGPGPTTVPVSSTPEAVRAPAAGKASVGVVGAGNFASIVLLPALRQSGARLAAVVSDKGVTAAHAARKFGFSAVSTDYREMLADPGIDTVFIATRHDLHAEMTAAAIRSGKHVFVEKPLALTEEQLEKVSEAYMEASVSRPVLLMVGFNRRFSPHARKIRALLSGTGEPKVFTMLVNAGMIPAGHWTQDPSIGGGRIVGEGCHFIDLLRFLAGSPIRDVRASRIGGSPSDGVREDKAVITISFADGSLGTIQYLANGHKSYPKERLEVFCGGKILVLDNFRRLTGYGWKGFREDRLWRQDKGHSAGVAAFIAAVEKGESSPIPFGELVEVARATLAAGQAVRER